MYYSTSIRCISAGYACLAENAGAKTVLTTLFMVAAVATTLVFQLWIQNARTKQENIVGINPGETGISIAETDLPLAQPQGTPELQEFETSSILCRLSLDSTNEGKETKIDMPGPVPPVVPIFTTLQVQATRSTFVGLSQTLPDEVNSNFNVSVGAQTVIDTSDTATLLHQTPTETCSFHIERNLLLEEQQTSAGVASYDSRVPSQPSQQPSPPVAAANNEAQIPNLNTEFKVATWIGMISAGAIVSIVSGLVGNEKATLTHKLLFKAFSRLNYISLVLSVGLFILTLTRPNIPGLVKTVKYIMWIAIGSITYALGCATCLLLPKLVEVVLVLVAPLVMVCLIAAFSFGSRN